jgi:RNA polymerase sigma factor for flagellar operon FliA
LWKFAGLNIASLEYAAENRGKDLLHYLPDEHDNLPSTILERSELERLLAEGIDGIPPIERTVLSLYYQEELTLPRNRAGGQSARVAHFAIEIAGHIETAESPDRQWPASRGILTA